MEEYGPLAGLIGTWKGSKGMDIAPEPDGIEQNPYSETITYEAIGDATNAEEQRLMVVRYLQVVRSEVENKVIHDQTGYWMWCPATNEIMFSLAIPRGLTLLAGGKVADGKAEENADEEVLLQVKSSLDDPHWTITQSPFLEAKAKTLGFELSLTVQGDELSYAQTTYLDIYGRQFDHTDENTLTRM